MAIGKIYQELHEIETTRDLIEKDLLSLEKYNHKKDYLMSQLIFHLEKLIVIYKKEKSYYLLDKVLRMKALLDKKKKDLKYSERDFDMYFSFLKKIVDFSKDALVSPLILPNVDRLAEKKIRQRLKGKSDIYISFHFKGVSFIVPYAKYKLISNFNPKKRIRLRYEGQNIFLGPLYHEYTRDELKEEKNSKVKILLLKGNMDLCAFYIDGLSQKIFIQKRNLLRGLKNTIFQHKHCKGSFRIKGKNYYYLEV